MKDRFSENVENEHWTDDSLLMELYSQEEADETVRKILQRIYETSGSSDYFD